MTDIVTAILKVIEVIPAFFKMVNRIAAKSKGEERGVILEMKANAELIQLYVNGEADLDHVIEKLEIEYLQKVLHSDFEFTTIKRGKVKKVSTGDIAFFNKYIGWTTEALFANLYVKIKTLKNFTDMQPKNYHVRKNVRLINVLKLIKLIIIHIDE